MFSIKASNIIKTLLKLPVFFCLFITQLSYGADGADPLSSWNEGATKSAIIDFVSRVSTLSNKDFVPEAERIAVFDNDGTLWSEQPRYFQHNFVEDQIKIKAASHPQWQTEEPFASVLKGDFDGALSTGIEALVNLSMASQADTTTEEFEQIANAWVSTATHPSSGRLYTQMVYQPMLDLLNYLRANGFKTYIVSGGTVEFIRSWAEEIYGIPPEQVIGTSGKLLYEVRDNSPVIINTAEADFSNNGPNKAIAIQKRIGRRPIAAFGNSDGDLAMLQWSDAGEHPCLCAFVHHTDEEREWAYDRNSSIGRLNRGLDEAINKDWVLIDIKNDWQSIYPALD